MEYLIYVFLGAVAGLASGLFGIGGGNIIVPILVILLSVRGIPADMSTHIAIATSLASIILTSLSSIYTHHQRQALDWNLLKIFIPSVVVGSLIGTVFFISADGRVLQILLGVFLVATGLKMRLEKMRKTLEVNIKPYVLTLYGAGIGSLSAVFGVGGGMFTTPLLTNFGVGIHRAIGVSAVSGFFIALCASIIYGSVNIPKPDLLTNNLGYIYLPAWIGIVVASAPFARLGALLAHQTDATYLKNIFGLFLLVVGARFILMNLQILDFAK